MAAFLLPVERQELLITISSLRSADFYYEIMILANVSNSRDNSVTYKAIRSHVSKFE